MVQSSLVDPDTIEHGDDAQVVITIRTFSISSPAAASWSLFKLPFPFWVPTNVQQTMMIQSILLHGGNAVDAAISAMVCLSAALPHRGGLGGGFMATIYRNSTCTSMNSRETCPSAASEAYFINRRDETVVGPKAIAVPGFLSGLYRTYERFSSKHLSWRQLLTPTIDLCVRGITVSESLSKDLLQFQSMIKNDPLTRSQFLNETTRTVLAKGDKMLCPQLANFLSDLSDSENPVDYFYRGEGSTRILKAIKDEDAFLTAQDLDDFETEHQYGLQSHVEDTTLCGPHPPSLFAVVQLAWESTEEGSFSVLAVDEKGDAASFGSSLGDKFGSRQFTNLGFFMNNAMGMFTYGAHPGSLESRNAPQAAKCPRTQMSPMIASKKGQTSLTVEARNLFEDSYDFERKSNVWRISRGVDLCRNVCYVTEVKFVAGGTNYVGLCRVVTDALLSTRTYASPISPLLYRNENRLELRSGDEALLSGY
ncbi:unnamed protein product [Haemonchus placei]|uniref:Gamma-glutamyltransferase n=1 Tax=Haemonchus placei TaxID=6290 RepID=A0A0N4WHH2_HAEPC|nr:unnamed protein product [Haemonchus placei]